MRSALALLLRQLLVAQEMDELLVFLLASLWVTLGQQVMDLQFFLVSEECSADRTSEVLSMGQPALSGFEVGRCCFLSLSCQYSRRPGSSGDAVPLTMTCFRRRNHANFNR